MAIFITGANGYLGSYVVCNLLREHPDRLALLVRAKDKAEAERRLWQAMQLHMGHAELVEHLRSRVDIYLGDITHPQLGLDDAAYRRLIKTTDSVIHIAASLNRKSAKSCFNVNLRGTTQVLKLARAAQDTAGLRRFSDVSTAATAGHRSNETVYEETAVQWDRSDYDPYARTKKFCEYMVEELLPDVPRTVFRPTIVMGDSRFAETTQFDMVRAYVTFARMKLLPIAAEWRHDIVPADYVGRAITEVHQAEKPRHSIYNLSSGEASLTSREITEVLTFRGKKMRSYFAPSLLRPFGAAVDMLAMTPRDMGVARPAALLQVFLPYVTFNTVFDNQRIVEELGDSPPSFGSYASELLNYAVGNDFKYDYLPWPETAAPAAQPEASSSPA